jgi:hypothetical protein
MFSSALTSARGPRRRPIRSIALLAGLVMVIGSSLTVSAATDTKPYTATWVSGGNPVANPPNSISLPSGSTSATLRLTNNANPQTLGSANITLPSDYVLVSGSVGTKSGNTLQVRNLNLAPGASTDITINLKTPCVGAGTEGWGLIVKQANNFSGPPGNDFVRASGSAAPSTTVSGSQCLLRFANQPNTTKTGNTIKDGYNSTGNGIKVEIYDPATNQVVDSDANVSLTLSYHPSGGTLSGGGATAAVAGVATFSSLSIDAAGAYKLRASSPAASNTPDSNQFMVADTVTECAGTGCNFQEQTTETTFKVTPKKGTTGADFVATTNLSGIRISCDFAPFNYPDNRQPNTIWYTYDDGTAASTKTNTIVIDKAYVQITPENGSSKYRICYTSPVPFKDRTGNMAQPDPWTDGPSAFFGQTWYTGLLPDCSGSKPVAPCSLGFTGTGSGDRVGTFLTPAGDPGFR